MDDLGREKVSILRVVRAATGKKALRANEIALQYDDRIELGIEKAGTTHTLQIESLNDWLGLLRFLLGHPSPLARKDSVFVIALMIIIGTLVGLIAGHQRRLLTEDAPLAPGVVKLLLDGQQRITSLYGVVRGRAPKFFDGNDEAFTGLRFHLDNEIFAFYQPLKMKDDPLWIDATELMQKGTAGLGEFVARLSLQPELAPRVGDYVGSRLLGVTDVDVHIEEVTGTEKTLDVIVDIFNRVNSGGTKLSKGDLALAKICADWRPRRAIL